MIYFFHLLILVSLLILERNDRPRRKLYRTIILLLYILIVGLRGTNVGVDSFTYYEHYYTYGKWGCDFIEPGFDWLNRILYAQGYEANSLFITMAAITVLFFYLALNRLDKEYSISAFCVYLLTFAFLVNGMRQGVACAVFLYAYKFIQEKKPIPYILLIAFAGLFHASALILLPLYFVLRYALPSLWYIVLYILSFAGLFIDLSVYIPEIGFGVRDYSGYVENMKFAQASWTGFIVSTLLNIGILYLMFSNQMFKKLPVLSNLVFAAFLFKNLGFSMPIMSRITIYFSWFVFLLYPILLQKNQRYLFRSRELTFGFLITINGAIWINAIFSPANKLLPYTFFWE